MHSAALLLLPFLQLAAAQIVTVTVSEGVSTTFTLPAWLYPPSATVTVTPTATLLVVPDTTIDSGLTTTTVYVGSSAASAASVSASESSSSFNSVVSSYLSSVLSAETASTGNATSTSTVTSSSTSTDTATTTVVAALTTVSTSTATGTATASGSGSTFTETMVLPSGMTTTIMMTGATNTSTGGPAVFTVAATANNALVGCALAGAMAAIGMNFL